MNHFWSRVPGRLSITWNFSFIRMFDWVSSGRQFPRRTVLDVLLPWYTHPEPGATSSDPLGMKDFWDRCSLWCEGAIVFFACSFTGGQREKKWNEPMDGCLLIFVFTSVFSCRGEGKIEFKQITWCKVRQALGKSPSPWGSQDTHYIIRGANLATYKTKCFPLQFARSRFKINFRFRDKRKIEEKTISNKEIIILLNSIFFFFF